MSDSMWNQAHKDLDRAIDALSEQSPTGYVKPELLLKLAEVEALLAIGQELSALNPNNTITFEKDETKPAPRVPKRIY